MVVSNSAKKKKLEIYSGSTSSAEPTKSISKFKEYAYGGKFRGDGKLIVSGSADGIVRVFTRWGHELRAFNSTKSEVWFVEFSPNNTDIMSAADDGIIVCFFLSSSLLLPKINLTLFLTNISREDMI